MNIARKHTGKIILWLTLMFMSSFGNTVEERLNMGIDFNAACIQALLLSLASIVLTSMLMMAVPFIARMAKKERLPYKSGKRLCMWNSIIMFVLSTVLLATTEVNFIGGVGAIIYYFINKWIFVSDSLPQEQPPVIANTQVRQKTPLAMPTQPLPTHICMSAEDETHRTYGNSNVYGSDIMLKQEPEQTKAVSMQPDPQPKAYRVQVQTVAKKKTEKDDWHYGVADPETKQCKNEGKQHIKRISRKIVCIILLCVCLAVSATGNIISLTSGVKEQEELAKLQKTNTSLTAEIARLKNDVEALKASKDYYFNLCAKNNEKLDFYDKCVVFIEDDGLNLYHKYGCAKFAAKYFWVYNPENAVAQGYKPCPRCID